jgi:capsular polysaccharide transport system permease protein
VASNELDARQVRVPSLRRSMPLLQGLTIQLRVIHAVLARELLTRYGRDNIGFLWVFLEPMLFTSAIAALWSFTKAHTVPGVSVVAFALTGYSSVLLWRNSAGRCTHVMSTNWALLYHRNVTPVSLYVARILIEVASASASFMLMALIFGATGFMDAPADPFKAVTAWFLLIGFTFGLSMCVGALASMSEVFDRIWHMSTYMLFPVSGAVFMVDWLPPGVRDIVLWLPMVHAIEMLRAGWFGAAVTTYESPSYLVFFDLVLLLLGLALVRMAGRRVEAH